LFATKHGDVFQQQTDHPFALAIWCVWVTPECRKVRSQGANRSPLWFAQNLSVLLALTFAFLLRLAEDAQFAVPLSFERIRN
jgi:hypothetical protein